MKQSINLHPLTKSEVIN